MYRRPFAPGQKTGAIYLKFSKIQGKEVKNGYAPDDVDLILFFFFFWKLAHNVILNPIYI